MKKIFMTLAVAGMVVMVSCGKGDKTNDSTVKGSDATEQCSPKDFEAEMQANGWTVNEDGNVVDADGNIIKTAQEVQDMYNSAIEQAHDMATEGVDQAREMVGNIPGANAALDDYQKAMDDAYDDMQSMNDDNDDDDDF